MKSLVRLGLLFTGFMVAGVGAALAQSVTVDASQPQGPVPQLQGYNAYGGSRGPQDQQLWRNLPARLQTSYSFLPNRWHNGDFSSIDSDVQEAVSHGTHVVANWGYEFGTFPFGVTAFQQDVKAGCARIQSMDPGWQYLEIGLEHDVNSSGIGLGDALTYYGIMAQAIQQYNAGRVAGLPPVLIGGFGLGSMYNWSSWITGLANYCAANNLPLDFCSYHTYANNSGPFWDIPGVARGCDAAMAQAGFPGRPQFITECASTYSNMSETAGFVSYEAAMWAQECYYCMASGCDVRPFHFVGSTSIFLGFYGLEIMANNGGDGAVNPIYNAMQMWSMLKGTALATRSDSLSNNGAVGSIDGTGVAVLVWNAGGGPSVNVNINNLPSNFQGGSIRVQQYQTDDVTSNYQNSASNSLLQQVGDNTIAGASSYSQTVRFTGNGVALLVLTPSNQAPPPPPPPPPSGTGFVLTNEKSGMDLNVNGASLEAGAPVIQWTHSPGATNALWGITPTGDGYYYLTCVNSGMDLNVDEASMAPGASVIQWTHTPGATNAEWDITENADGTFTLTNRNSGLVLDVQGGGTSAGTPVVQSAPRGAASQEWAIPGFTSGGANLIQDPGYESQPVGPPVAPWASTGPATFGCDHQGVNASMCAYIYDGGTGAWSALTQTVQVNPNTTYTLSCSIQTSPTFPAQGLMGAKAPDGTILGSQSFGQMTNYTQVATSFNSGSNTSVVVFAGFTDQGSGAWIQADNWSMTDSSGVPPGSGSGSSSSGTGTSAASSGGGGGGRCGLTGLETVLILGLMALRKRRG